MPLTATLEDIKAHQNRVEKDKINPHNLPPCPRCSVDSIFFKIHAYRERRFLIIIEMLIEAAYCNSPQALYAANHYSILCQLRRIRKHDVPAGFDGR